MFLQLDGRPIQVAAYGGRWVIAPSKNTHSEFQAAYNAGVPHHGAHKTSHFSDINGDGLDDLLLYVNGQWRVHYTQHAPHRIVEFKSRLGASIEVQYALSNGNKPALAEQAKRTSFSFGNDKRIPDNSPKLLVASHAIDNGIGGTLKTTYRYGPRARYADGRGGTTPQWQEVENVDAGITEKTWFAQSWPFVGETTKVVRYRSGRSHSAINSGATCPSHGSTALLNCENRRYQHFKRADGSIQTYLSQSDDYHYSPENGAKLQQVTQTFSKPDAYGNVKTATNTIQDATTGKSWKTTTSTGFLNNTSAWFVGLPERVETTYEGPGERKTRLRTYQYHPAHGLISKMTLEPARNNSAEYLETTYTYDGLGLLKTKNNRGFDFDGKVLPPRGLQVVTTAGTDSSGNAVRRVTSKNALGHVITTEHHLTHGQPTKVTDANGLSTTSVYNGQGRLVRQVTPDGTISTSLRRWAAATDAPTALFVVTSRDAAGGYSEVHLDRLSREVRRVSLGLDGRKVFQDTQYNALGQVARTSQPYFAGESILWTVFTYDFLGRIRTINAPDGADKTLTYNGYTTTETDALGRSTTTTVNAKGQTIKVVDAAGGILTHHYNVLDQLVKTVDPKQRQTIITYDIHGRKLSLNDPDMGRWQYRYDSFGQLRQQTDAKQQVSTTEYDLLGRPVRRTEVDGESTWTYDKRPGQSLAQAKASRSIGKPISAAQKPKIAAGSPLAGTFQSNYASQLQYDVLGRLKKTQVSIDGSTYTTSAEYDAVSRIHAVTKPDGFIVENVYNEFGHLVALKSPIEQSDDYDEEHLADLMLDVLELADKAEDEAKNLVAQAEQYQEKAAEYQKQADYYERMVGYSDSQIRALRAYAQSIRAYADKLMKRAEYYSSRSRYYAWLADVYYKRSKRFTSRWWSSWRNRYYAWRSAYYNRVAARNAYIARYYAYWANFYANWADRIDAMADERAKDKAEKKVKQYTALAEAEVSKAKEALAASEKLKAEADNYKAQAAMIAANLDDAGYAVWWRADQSDASGRPSRQIYGNGVLTAHSYDPANGQLNHIHAGLTYDSPIQSISYVYDAVNNVREKHNDATGVAEYFNDYDALDRLKTWSYTSGTQQLQDAWSYDAIGNITQSQRLGSYTYGTNKFGRYSLKRAGNHGAVSYDANGNITARSSLQMTYSSFNKPVMLTDKGYQNYFSYGPDRRRFKQVEIKQVGGLSTRTTLYAAPDYERITSQQGGSQSVEHKHYIRVGQKIIAVHSRKSSSNTTQYFHYDALNSIEAITDHQGKVLERFRYTPFGERIATKGNDNVTTRGYTGHEHLAGIGLIHMNARVYDPVLQRFLSPDTIVQAPLDAQTFNRYAYVRNNPAKYTDPSGHVLGIGGAFKREARRFERRVRHEVKRVSNRVRRAFRDIRAELKRLCDSGCYVSAETNGEETRVSGGGGGGQVRAPSPGTSSQSSVGVSITINSRGQISSYSAYVGYGGANFGYTTGGDYSGGELFAEGLSGDRFSIYGFGNVEFTMANARGLTSIFGPAPPVGGVRREADYRITVSLLVDESTGTHEYRIRGEICARGPMCDAALADSVFESVNSNDIPFIDDDLGNGRRDLPPLGDPIQHFEFMDLRKSINVTLEGHTFHPGSVVHRVHFEQGMLYYDLIGSGRGSMPSFNNYIGVLLFRPGVEKIVREYGR